MAKRKRIPYVDALREVRRALRILRRVEVSLAHARKSEARADARWSEDASLAEMAERGRG